MNWFPPVEGWMLGTNPVQCWPQLGLPIAGMMAGTRPATAILAETVVVEDEAEVVSVEFVVADPADVVTGTNLSTSFPGAS